MNRIELDGNSLTLEAIDHVAKDRAIVVLGNATELKAQFGDKAELRTNQIVVKPTIAKPKPELSLPLKKP